MTEVFISYKQDEREAVQIIADTLADLKVEVWFDTKLRAGNSFDEEIAAALRVANAVLVCWTPAAVESEWVRGEATEGLQTNRLAACFLRPTPLIPPFNLTHAEDLSAWAGQVDDPAWLKLLERLGELIGRPGLATFHAIMRPGASIQEMKAWASANGADPLVDGVWARIELVEGEPAKARLERERAEARAAAERRRAQWEKSRRLARERGLRDPRRERRRFLMLAGSVAAIAVLSLGGFIYFNDAQRRDRILRDDVNTTEQARAFIDGTPVWHPVAGRAHEKLERLDTDKWIATRTDGSVAALEAYVADASHAPQGSFLVQAQDMLAEARRVRDVQTILERLRLYDGPANGALDSLTRGAIELFRYRRNMPVTSGIDDALLRQLDEALAWWTHPRLDELVARSVGPPTEADYVRLAASLDVDAATLRAVVDLETPRARPAFDAEGRMIILFERQIFSRLTDGRYDASHPEISARSAGGYKTGEREYARLAEAFALDPTTALAATSWGRFQLLGLNHQRAGFDTVGEFVRFMSESEVNQLEAGFIRFIRAADLTDELQNHDWAGFARRFIGGPSSARYAERLSAAYERATKELAARFAPPQGQENPSAPPASVGESSLRGGEREQKND